MAWTAHYLPPSDAAWQGRADAPAASCFFQRIQLLDLRKTQTTVQQAAFALLGFCCDEGIRRNLGRPGAAQGPEAIRTALAGLACQRVDITCYDAGNITCDDGDLEAAQHALGEAVFRLLQQGITPIVLGGGHEMAWGHYQGLAKQLQQADLAIINFDAHFDMRPLLPGSKGSSGTPFLQIAEDYAKQHRTIPYYCFGIQRGGNMPALFSTAKKYQTHMLLAEDFHLNKPDIKNVLTQALAHHQQFYVSLCLDVFASAYAPGVSAPQALGLTPWQVIPLLRRLASSGKVKSYDLAEMSPPFDIDARTAKLAANLIADIIHHHQFGNTTR